MANNVTQVDVRGVFKGSDEQLCNSIDALLDLNAKGAVSHRVPGMAVTLLEAAADRLAATRPAPKADDSPGDKADCGHPNPIWFADNELWNAVMGGRAAKDDPGGVLCPTCFMLKAGEVLRVSHPAPKADSALVGELREDFDLAHALIQEAKGAADGPEGGLVTNHLDAAEGHLDTIEAHLAALSDRDVVLEEAAKVAENEKVDAEGTGHPEDYAYNRACTHSAEAIRALKGGVDE